MTTLMLGWISEEIRIWYCQRMLSGGTLLRSTHIFFFSNVFVLYVRQKTNTKFIFDNIDVGPYIPPSTSPIQWKGEVAAVPQYAQDYQVVEQNLEGLTVDIPDMPLE